MFKRVGSIIVALLLIGVFIFGAFASEVNAAEGTTGIVKDDGRLIFVRNGKFDPSFTGLQKYKGTFYAVEKGVVNLEFSGIVKKHTSGRWYYVRNGVYDKTFTGFAPSIKKKTGKFYVVKGEWKRTTGFVKVNGKQYYVVKGKLYKKTGLTKISGTNYVLRKGRVDTSYTGVIENLKTGVLQYVKKGKHDISFTGVAKNKADGKDYYVINGDVDTSLNDTKTYKGTTYKVTNGVAVAKKYLQVTGYAVNRTTDGDTILQVTFKNLSGEVMGCPTAYVTLLDKNKKAINVNSKGENDHSVKLQSWTALLPNQSVTVETNITKYTKAAYFSIEAKGWGERTKVYWFAIENAPKNIPLSRSVTKVIEKPVKSTKNSIEHAYTVSFGSDKIKVSGLQLDCSKRNPTFKGKVTNNSGKSITNLNLHFQLLDSKGNIVEWFTLSSSNTLNIAKGKTATFNITMGAEYIDNLDKLYAFTISYYSGEFGGTSSEGFLSVLPKAGKK